MGCAMSFFTLVIRIFEGVSSVVAALGLGGLAELLQRRCKLVDVVEGNAMILGAKQPPAEQPG
jgi:hypothetical protein